jgi:hypothetical protein
MRPHDGWVRPETGMNSVQDVANQMWDKVQPRLNALLSPDARTDSAWLKQVLIVIGVIAALWIAFRATRTVGQLMRFAFCFAWVALWSGGWLYFWR